MIERCGTRFQGDSGEYSCTLLRGHEGPHGQIYTYKFQPFDNVDAWRLGEACRKAADDPKCGDYIDRGLILLRELEAMGYGILRLAERTAAEPT